MTARDLTASGDDPVVIVGMAVEAPGGIDTPENYWALLSEQREALGPFPTDRGWSLRELFAGSRREGFKQIHDLGGFLSAAAEFDPEFFGISPREAVAMDPQQRVALRLAWRALENSGINPDDLAGHDAGCYVGRRPWSTGPRSPSSPTTAVISSPARRSVSSPGASRTRSTWRVRPSPSTPRAHRRCPPCTSRCRRCAPATAIWPWPAVSA